MKKERPETTLFMLISTDGKISTGDNDDRDVDKDYKKIIGVKEGLGQYYDLEKTTDIYSLNSGRVMAKMGVNTKNCPINCPEVSFIIIDDKHLTKEGVENLINRTKKLFLVTSNKKHPALNINNNSKLEVVYYNKEIDFVDLFQKLKSKYKVDKLTIQSGGTLNATFIRNSLIDHISLVVVPCLIGGENTSSLIDGESLHFEKDLKDIKALKLIEAKVLKNSYLHLRYNVLN
jgi:2,5-diamino-6-(ribosylamino)-4(3H)-pyrimidinone 5'-phosphate reductase